MGQMRPQQRFVLKWAVTQERLVLGMAPTKPNDDHRTHMGF